MGLLTAFPKLLSSGAREHTFIDTESVRYVYQPLESFFVLIITNKTSNIVEDLHTIQVLSKLVPDICGTLSEAAIRDKQFELIFGLDELITAGGYSENLTVQQVRVNMEMESHEEKLHDMIQDSKRKQAKEQSIIHQNRLKAEARERAKLERAGLGGYAKPTGFGSSSKPGIGGMGGMGQSPRGIDTYSSPSYSSDSGMTSPTYNRPAESPAPSSQATGMKLGGGSKTPGMSFMDAMAAEDDLKDIPPMSAHVAETASAPAPAPVVSNDPIGVTIEEKITVVLNREGTLEQLEVKGSLYVAVNDANSACCRLQLRSSNANGISYQTHPKVDKRLFDQQSVLALKDPSKPFPSARVGVLRWSLKSQDESLLPLNIVCWPEEQGDGKMNVTIEYSMERKMALDNVNILIPLGSQESPAVAHVDGQFQHNSAQNSLLWHLDRIDDSNDSGTLEFSIRGTSVDAFFPLAITFFSKNVYSDVAVEAVARADDTSAIRFGFDQLLTTDNYQIV